MCAVSFSQRGRVSFSRRASPPLCAPKGAKGNAVEFENFCFSVWPARLGDKSGCFTLLCFSCHRSFVESLANALFSTHEILTSVV